MPLTHFDKRGSAWMVDVGAKSDTVREAVAEGRIIMGAATLRLIMEGSAKKGDVLGVARLAGIMAAKKTPEIIPLCHNIPLSSVEVDFTVDETRSCVVARALVRTTGKTGVEMEAITAVSAALLTVYDMVKSAGKDMTITDISLLEKSGGKSGHYKKNNAAK
ncbi:MAG: cyclic pyranopterin monophosphate synthase MoaC [Nitrospinae bacterium]|nr:cyclic pyranopterin monophosphate synthase MoaC [Nitrospinota bacterium]